MEQMKLTEKFNQHKLKYVIDNFSKIAGDLGYDESKSKHLLQNLKDYLARSRNGMVQTIYNHKPDSPSGRLYNSSATYGMTQMPNHIRNFIADGLYADYDIINCGPSLFYNKARQETFFANKEADALKNYLNNREECLEKVTYNGNPIPRFAAKKLYTELTQGAKLTGSVKVDGISYFYNVTEHLRQYADDCERIAKFLSKRSGSDYSEFKEDFKKQEAKLKKTQRTGKPHFMWVYRIISKFELEIIELFIQTAYGYTDIDELPYAVYTYDGMMLPHNLIDNPDRFMSSVTEYINEKWNYIVKFAIKPTNSKIGCPETLPVHVDCEYLLFSDFAKFRTNNFSTVSRNDVDMWINNTMKFVVDGGEMKVITINRYREESTGLQSEICNISKMKHILMTLRNIHVAFTEDNEKFDKTWYLANKARASDGRTEEGRDDRRFKTVKLASYLEMAHSTTAHIYERYTYKPHLKRRRTIHTQYEDEEVNLFRGFLHDNDAFLEESKNIDVTHTHMYKYQKQYMFRNNEDEFNNWLDFIAHAIQEPSGERPAAHAFISDAEGCGKGLLVDWLRNMIGERLVITINNASAALTRNFNSEMAGTLFRAFEELENGGGTIKNDAILKAITKETQERMEKKGVDPVYINAVARFIFFSNDRHILRLPPKQRRYNVHHIDDSKANDRTVFDPIVAELSDPAICKAWFEFFATRKYEYRSASKIIRNDFMKEQAVNSMDKPLRFLQEYVEQLHDKNYGHKDNPDAICWRIPKKELIANWKSYGGGSDVTLFLSIQKFGIVIAPKRARTNYTSGAYAYYDLYPTRIANIYRENLENENFKFDFEHDNEPEPEEEVSAPLPDDDNGELDAAVSDLDNIVPDWDDLEDFDDLDDEKSYDSFDSMYDGL